MDEPAQQAQAPVTPPAGDVSPPIPVLRRSRYGAIALALASLALALLVWQWLDARSERQFLRQELARRLSEMETQNREARMIAAQVQDATRDLQVKIGVLDDNLTRSQNQQVALEALYQELSRNRDDWSLAEIEQILIIASQQLQLAADVRSALIALQTADARLQRIDKPQLVPLRKVIAKDIERLKAAPYVDTVGISVKLDTILAQVDTLPLAMEVRPAVESAAATEAPPEEAAWRRVLEEAWNGFKQMVRLQKLDKREVPLLAPEQAYFARENLKLRLLSARIALLQRDQGTFAADIKATRDWLNRYFDTRSPVVTGVLAKLRELGESPINIALPEISESLEAVRNYKLARSEQTSESTEVAAPVAKQTTPRRGSRSR